MAIQDSSCLGEPAEACGVRRAKQQRPVLPYGGPRLLLLVPELQRRADPRHIRFFAGQHQLIRRTKGCYYATDPKHLENEKLRAQGTFAST